MDGKHTELERLLAQAETGDGEARYRAAIALEFGEFGVRDAARAFGLMKLAAEGGHAGAMVKLCDYYDSGAGVPADPVLACDWAERAARSGSAAAAKRLSRFYMHGRGVETDMIRAAFWEREYLLREVASGSCEAQYLLGNFYYEGRPGHPQEPAKAHKLFSEAAGCGHKGAMLRLAVMHERGLACVHDEDMAADWCDRALGEGSPQAARLRRVSILRPEADAGDREAMFELAMLNGGASGEGRDMLRDAARRGSAAAAAALLAYFSGERAAEVTEAERAAWSAAAAAAGAGSGAKDLSALRAELEKAAAAGDEHARSALRTLEAGDSAKAGEPVRLSGQFPPPAGKYELSASGKVLTAFSGSGNFTFRCSELAAIAAAWAVPAKGGGYAAMIARFRDGSQRTLLQSEGYTAGLAAAYCAAARQLAVSSGVKYLEEPQGADA